MSIASFDLDEMDQTANLSPTMRMDQNGEKCALIRVNTTQSGFTFDVGSLGVTATEFQNAEHPAEIWVYVPHGVKKISIQHPRLGSVRDYDLKQSLKSGRTYILNLTHNQVVSTEVDYSHSQILDIDVTPNNATLYINGGLIELGRDGRASRKMAFGTHPYRVSAPGYHPVDSYITINDKENSHKLSVRLKQAFGYLTVMSTPQSAGGDVYIDDEHVGTLPLTRLPLNSGLHQLTVHKKLYQPFTQQISMQDSASVVINPQFEPNSAVYDIVVTGDKDAEIYDNGELLGRGQWHGRLEAGEHTIEAKKKSHTTVSEHVTVVNGRTGSIGLSSPTPIYGMVEIKSDPAGAEVYIDTDSKPAGKTPLMNYRMLTGAHHIRLMMPGYKTEEFDIGIREGETERIERTMTDYCEAVISSEPIADISINGQPEGLTPLRLNRVAGVYDVRIEARGYSPFSKRMRLDGNTKDINIRLRRNYIRTREFYIHAGASMGCMTGINVGAGFYLANVNLEGSYIIGLTRSETIYWSDKTGTEAPIVATYKPSAIDVRAGYGIRLHSRLRLTPQVGARFVVLGETLNVNDTSDSLTGTSTVKSSVADGANAVGLTAGVRFNCAITSWLGISVSPEYIIPVSKSGGYKALSEISPRIRGYAGGFNCNASLNIML